MLEGLCAERFRGLRLRSALNPQPDQVLVKGVFQNGGADITALLYEHLGKSSCLHNFVEFFFMFRVWGNCASTTFALRATPLRFRAPDRVLV